MMRTSTATRCHTKHIVLGLYIVASFVVTLLMHHTARQLTEESTLVHTIGHLKQEVKRDIDDSISTATVSFIHPLNSEQTMRNAKQLQQLRRDYQLLQQQQHKEEHQQDSSFILKTMFQLKRDDSSNNDATSSILPLSPLTTQHCRYMVVDMGIGEDQGHFLQQWIESEWPTQTTTTTTPAANKITNLNMAQYPNETLATGLDAIWFRDVFQEYFNQGHVRQRIRPEHSCYFGFVGEREATDADDNNNKPDPALTRQLQQLQYALQSAQPRPLQYVHLFHQDNDNNDDDENMSLPTLLRHHMHHAPLDSVVLVRMAQNHERTARHLKQLVTSGVPCELSQRGTQLDLYVPWAFKYSPQSRALRKVHNIYHVRELQKCLATNNIQWMRPGYPRDPT